MTSASLPRMGPLPGGPLSRRHAPAATLPGAGRHNRVSWAGITLPSPARPGPGGGPGASEPVRLGPRRGAEGGHGGTAQPALDRSWPEDPRSAMTGLDPHPYLPLGSALPCGFPA